METSVTFKSDLFKPFLPNDFQVNPGCYGAELAWWLTRELSKKAIFTTYPNFEDWGWFIEFSADENEYWLCCGNVHGTDREWHVFLNPKAKGIFGRNKAPLTLAKPLLLALRTILSESAAISNVEWDIGMYSIHINITPALRIYVSRAGARH